eukprot:UN03511
MENAKLIGFHLGKQGCASGETDAEGNHDEEFFRGDHARSEAGEIWPRYLKWKFRTARKSGDC